MRALRSPALGAAAAVLAVLSLAACVPSATPKTADTLAPLALPFPTVPVATAPPVTVAGAGATTILDPASAVTLATIAAPVTAPAATAPSTPVATTTSITSTKAPNSTPSTYTVVAKDTLSGVGRRCAITPQAVADYNSWSDGIAHPIYPGTVVKLPCTPEGSTTATATATTTTTTVKGAGTTTTTITPGPGGLYTVVAGDYLAGIAAKTGTTVNGIVQVNGWTDGTNHLIIAGQQIKLPAKTK